MKKVSKGELLSVAACLLPVLLGLLWWNELPTQVPTHFGLNNQPDGYSSRAFAVFGLPLVLALLDGACIFGLRADPKRERQSKALRGIFLWFIPVLSCVVVPICLLAGLGRTVNVGLILQLIVGTVFIVIGNYLPKCRRNYTMGIRLPWTLASEDNWDYTHRIGGFCWVIAGALMLLNGFIGAAWLLFVIIVLAVGIPVAASYRYYRRHGEAED